MSYKGTVQGNTIVLDEPVSLSDGTRVEVTIVPETKHSTKGTPGTVLNLLAATLTHEEAELIRQAAREIRQIDASLWENNIEVSS
jgi:hypothetical protein